MIIFLAVALVAAEPVIPYPLVAELDDRPEVNGARLRSPTDALYIDGALYVSDAHEHTVFVLKPDGSLSRFGRAGSGPGELQHAPVRLQLDGDNILVEEWNRLFRSTFSKTGEFKDRVKRGPTWGQRAEQQVRRVSPVDVPDIGFMLYDERHDCYFSKPDDHAEHGIHLGRGLIHEDDRGLLYIIKTSGVIEVYERPCRLLHTMNIPLARFRAEVKPHHLLRKIVRARYKEDKGPVYVHGRPIFDAAVAGLERVWLLVKDENLEKSPRYQRVRDADTWLFEVDPLAGNIRFSMALDQPVVRIRYHDGFLILISDYEATVRVYRVSD